MELSEKKVRDGLFQNTEIIRFRTDILSKADQRGEKYDKNNVRLPRQYLQIANG